MSFEKSGEISMMSSGEGKNAMHRTQPRRGFKKMPSAEGIERLAQVYRMLGEPIRLKIVLSLMNGEQCVQHILEGVGATQSATSHQLRILKDNGIVKCRREGQNVFYSLLDQHIYDIIALGVKHLGCEGGNQ